jgi:superfamily II DNA or RNA helicase
MESLRNKRQVEFAKKWMEKKNGILYLCPRFGKIKTSIHIMDWMNEPKTLIVYPIETIRKSWEEDFMKWGYNPMDVDYVSTASLWKLVGQELDYELIILDEIHLLSPANIEELKAILSKTKVPVLGLSGTISDRTEAILNHELNLYVVAHYDIATGIKEGVITDYQITIVMTNLDSKTKYIVPSKRYPKFKVTEAERYDFLTARIEEIKANYRRDKQIWEERVQAASAQGKLFLMNSKPDLNKELGLLPIQRMHIFKKSLAKLEATKYLLSRAQAHHRRVLVFCGTTEIADSLGIPVFHSKAKDLEIRDNFCAGQGEALATVDMFEAGVTVAPIYVAIINSHDSNPENLAQRISRLTGFEYDNPTKVAKVYIVCTNTIEKSWLDKALELFDLSKVNYINY